LERKETARVKKVKKKKKMGNKNERTKREKTKEPTKSKFLGERKGFSCFSHHSCFLLSNMTVSL